MQSIPIALTHAITRRMFGMPMHLSSINMTKQTMKHSTPLERWPRR